MCLSVGSALRLLIRGSQAEHSLFMLVSWMLVQRSPKGLINVDTVLRGFLLGELGLLNVMADERGQTQSLHLKPTFTLHVVVKVDLHALTMILWTRDRSKASS